MIRKSLDLCLDCTTSWHELAEVLRAEVAGTGLALDALASAQKRRHPGAPGAPDALTLVPRRGHPRPRDGAPGEPVWGLFLGILATDKTWGWVKGAMDDVGQTVEFGIQALRDGATRVVLHPGRLAGLSEGALRAGLEKLPGVGVPLTTIRTWLSDGSRTYSSVLAMRDLAHLPCPRSLFPLGRNLAGNIAADGAAHSKEAAQRLCAVVHTVGDAPTE